MEKLDLETIIQLNINQLNNKVMKAKIYSFENGVLQFNEVMKLNRGADIYLFSMDKELSKDEVLKMLNLEKAEIKEIKGYRAHNVGFNGVANNVAYCQYEIFLNNPI